MTTNRLNKITISTPAFEWLQNKYRAVDSRNHNEYAKFLAGDCMLQFGNNPVVQGDECLLLGIDNFWRNIHGLNHHFINIVGTDDLVVLEALIDYTRVDDKIVTIPCVTIIERNTNGLAAAIKIFIDTTPVFTTL